MYQHAFSLYLGEQLVGVEVVAAPDIHGAYAIMDALLATYDAEGRLHYQYGAPKQPRPFSFD